MFVYLQFPIDVARTLEYRVIEEHRVLQIKIPVAFDHSVTLLRRRSVLHSEID